MAFTMLVDAYLTEAKMEASLRPGSLLVVDADHFKLINDTLGHQQGDAAQWLEPLRERCDRQATI